MGTYFGEVCLLLKEIIVTWRGFLYRRYEHTSHLQDKRISPQSYRQGEHVGYMSGIAMGLVIGFILSFLLISVLEPSN